MSDTGWPNPPQNTPPANVGNGLIRLKPEELAIPTPAPVASDRLRLSSVADVKREIRRIYIDTRNGKVSSTEAGKLVWMLQTLANLIVDHELEKRLGELEGKSK